MFALARRATKSSKTSLKPPASEKLLDTVLRNVVVRPVASCSQSVATLEENARRQRSERWIHLNAGCHHAGPFERAIERSCVRRAAIRVPCRRRSKLSIARRSRIGLDLNFLIAAVRLSAYTSQRLSGETCRLARPAAETPAHYGFSSFFHCATYSSTFA
jgi:hypothetical protein